LEPQRRPFTFIAQGPLVLLAGLSIALLSACTPGSGLPTQTPGTSTTSSTGEATGSTPAATSSTGGSVVPVINF